MTTTLMSPVLFDTMFRISDWAVNFNLLSSIKPDNIVLRRLLTCAVFIDTWEKIQKDVLTNKAVDFISN